MRTPEKSKKLTFFPPKLSGQETELDRHIGNLFLYPKIPIGTNRKKSDLGLGQIYIHSKFRHLNGIGTKMKHQMQKRSKTQ